MNCSRSIASSAKKSRGPCQPASRAALCSGRQQPRQLSAQRPVASAKRLLSSSSTSSFVLFFCLFRQAFWCWGLLLFSSNKAAAALTSLMASRTHTYNGPALFFFSSSSSSSSMMFLSPHYRGSSPLSPSFHWCASATNFLVHREMVTSEHSEDPCTRSILAKRPTFVILNTAARFPTQHVSNVYFGAFIMAHYASRSNSLVLILNYIVGTPFLVVVHGGGIRDYINTYIGRDCNTLTHWYENLESYSSEISLLSSC
jgi:hypothetical protein